VILPLLFLSFVRAKTKHPNAPKLPPLNESEFDVQAYIEKSWFIQKQQINPYQSEDQLYCIVATYNARSDSSGFIDVKNYGNNNQVNGPAQVSDEESFFSSLCAKQVEGGELAVAPCSIYSSLTAGPYWVLAVADDYSWAIVSGGQPDQPYPQDDGSTLCTTKEGSSFLDTNGSGLWLFTREQVAPAATIKAMENTLESMGFYTGLLKDVAQEGCLYEGATLK